MTNRNSLLCSKQDWRRQAHVAWWLANYLQSIKGPKHFLLFCTRYQTIYLPASHWLRWVLQITVWFKIILTYNCIRDVIFRQCLPTQPVTLLVTKSGARGTQSAPVRRRYLAGITSWNFAEHTSLMFESVPVEWNIYSVCNVWCGMFHRDITDGRETSDMKWHTAGGWRSVKCSKA